MTDFVIVIAAAAIGLASPAAPAPGAAEAAATVPLNAPTVGFRTYPDAASCERATVGLVAPAGRRLICLPIETQLGGLATAY